jgi:hypothetical protein
MRFLVPDVSALLVTDCALVSHCLSERLFISPHNHIQHHTCPGPSRKHLLEIRSFSIETHTVSALDLSSISLVSLHATQSVPPPTNRLPTHKMRFFTPLLALAGLLTLCVIAAPIANANLAIPVHGAATYETDLAAAVAYARSAGVAPVADMSPTANGATNFGKQCGTYSIVAGGFLFPTYTTDYYCNETEQAEEMKYFYNHWCGFCVVFDGMLMR